MHDYSIKLLAVVEGPRELGDNDDDSHYCQANDRIRCMTELTAEGDTSSEKRQYTKRGRDISDDLFKKKRHFRNSILLFHLFQALIFDDGVHGIILCDL